MTQAQHLPEVEPLPLPARDYQYASLGPDGRFLALGEVGPTWVIRIHDLQRNTQFVLTPPDAGSSQWPAWTPDGRIIYRGTRQGFRNLYQRAADGSGAEQQLTEGGRLHTPTDVSRDGKWVIFSEMVPETGGDLWALPLDGSGPARPVANSRAGENLGLLSPDGNWLAYMSNESGQSEVYVQSFPDAGQRQLVSAGGLYPWWSGDGREIRYIGLDSRPYVASVSGRDALETSS